MTIIPSPRTSPRSSAFKVAFADDPDIRVVVGGRVLDPSEYTVEFNSKTEYDENDWAGNGTGWGSSSDGKRSVRLILHDVPADSEIKLIYTSRVDGEAEPGTTAWSNFGYSYVVDGTTLQASPSNVVVRVPSVPKLQKKMQHNGEPEDAGEELEFTFCVYTGQPVEGLKDMTQSEAETALTDAGRTYHFFTADITEKDGVFTESDIYKMEAENFWVDGDLYTITEMDPGLEYRFVSINGFTEPSYSFTYKGDTNLTINAVNEQGYWSIKVQKGDIETDYLWLPGAVFGIYSPEPTDKLKNTESFRESVVGQDGVTYYLARIARTDENGVLTFEQLLQDNYVIRELAPPAGYKVNEELYPVSREDKDVNRVAEVIVLDEPGETMPYSGGAGPEKLEAIGAAALITALFCAVTGALRKKKGRA